MTEKGITCEIVRPIAVLSENERGYTRKTYISSLIDAGININTVRSYAGHADERTTYFNYCYDRTPDAEKKQLLEKALA